MCLGEFFACASFTVRDQITDNPGTIRSIRHTRGGDMLGGGGDQEKGIVQIGFVVVCIFCIILYSLVV